MTNHNDNSIKVMMVLKNLYADCGTTIGTGVGKNEKRLIMTKKFASLY